MSEFNLKQTNRPAGLLNAVEKLMYWAQMAIPAVYGEELVYADLQAKTISKLNEVVEQLNVNTEWTIYLLDNGVEQETVNYINGLIQNGTIGNLINNELLGGFNSRFDTIEKDVKETLQSINGGIGGSFQTVEDIPASADRKKIFLITSGTLKGHYVYWNGSQWTDGGVYMSANLPVNNLNEDQLFGTMTYTDSIGQCTGSSLTLSATNLITLYSKPVLNSGSIKSIDMTIGAPNGQFRIVACSSNSNTYTILRQSEVINCLNGTLSWPGNFELFYVNKGEFLGVQHLNSQINYQLITNETPELRSTFETPYIYDSSDNSNIATVGYSFVPNLQYNGYMNLKFNICVLNNNTNKYTYTNAISPPYVDTGNEGTPANILQVGKNKIDCKYGWLKGFTYNNVNGNPWVIIAELDGEIMTIVDIVKPTIPESMACSGFIPYNKKYYVSEKTWIGCFSFMLNQGYNRYTQRSLTNQTALTYQFTFQETIDTLKIGNEYTAVVGQYGWHSDYDLEIRGLVEPYDNLQIEQNAKNLVYSKRLKSNIIANKINVGEMLLNKNESVNFGYSQGLEKISLSCKLKLNDVSQTSFVVGTLPTYGINSGTYLIINNESCSIGRMNSAGERVTTPYTIQYTAPLSVGEVNVQINKNGRKIQFKIINNGKIIASNIYMSLPWGYENSTTSTFGYNCGTMHGKITIINYGSSPILLSNYSLSYFSKNTERLYISGDSITEGFSVKDTEKYPELLNESGAINYACGIGGATSENLLSVLNGDVGNMEINKIMLFWGSNKSPSLINDLKSAIDRNLDKSIYIMTIPTEPIDSQNIISLANNYENVKVVDINKYLLLSNGNLNPIYYENVDNLGQSYNDNLHPNSEGHKKIFECIKNSCPELWVNPEILSTGNTAMV